MNLKQIKIVQKNADEFRATIGKVTVPFTNEVVWLINQLEEKVDAIRALKALNKGCLSANTKLHKRKEELEEALKEIDEKSIGVEVAQIARKALEDRDE